MTKIQENTKHRVEVPGPWHQLSPKQQAISFFPVTGRAWKWQMNEQTAHQVLHICDKHVLRRQIKIGVSCLHVFSALMQHKARSKDRLEAIHKYWSNSNPNVTENQLIFKFHCILLFRYPENECFNNTCTFWVQVSIVLSSFLIGLN